jgi:DNA polymerase-1
MPSTAKKLYLFDGSSYVYRAFYALPPLKTKEGFPTGAIYGFLRMFFAFLKEKKPQYVAVVFDKPGKTFRNTLFKEYKTQRKPAPDDLKVQIPVIKELLKLLGIPVLEVEGFEADDVIATLAKKFSEKGWEVYIYTPDKDMVQLLTYKGVRIINPLTEEEITPEKVKKKFGVEPYQIPSYLALVGDKVDNIPGVEGIGPKRAREILSKFGTVEEILKNWENLPPSVKKYFAKVRREELERWLKLVKLRTDIDLNVNEEKLRIKKPNWEVLKEKLLSLEMKSLVKELDRLKKVFVPGQRSLF